MSVKENDWISVEYTGKFEDGKVFDSNVGKEPLKFKIGARMVIPGFERAVVDMEKGQEKEVVIKPEDGYGPKNDEIVELSKAAFQDASVIEEGKELEMMTNMGPLLVEVIKIEEDKVKVKLNHPMAGKVIHFKLKILDVLNEEEAKKEELNFQEQIKKMREAQEKMQEEHHHHHGHDCDCGEDSSEEDDCCDCGEEHKH
ncbi:MAG: peptidylprolyl isomerase [archaeon]|nr:peptidylprolyl isomerase [archaeon]MDD2477860.1 peptidylprolyl isomerase [Candidatus ainarchaeum sp.]MDD3084595.1 peptidylprolyl isomerase [Candidatus ainarchaeum sp.]MDD4221116.1 peptidylprolyl isomerase [Candidatus ainarchaeum sp.]MDD4662603.1 peptidylprolyl isomerase [Candidatus ainarchaeum sp.]